MIVGKIYFLLVRIKIKHMELEIRKRESTGSGPNTYNDSETLAKYEIMDGAPVRGQLNDILFLLVFRPPLRFSSCLFRGVHSYSLISGSL